MPRRRYAVDSRIAQGGVTYAHEALSAGMQECAAIALAGWRSREILSPYAKKPSGAHHRRCPPRELRRLVVRRRAGTAYSVSKRYPRGP